MRVPDYGILGKLLACPRCRAGALAHGRAGWICSECSSGFPDIGGIPWLFAEPAATLADWRARAGLLLAGLEREAGGLRAELDTPGLRPLTRTRLERLAAAYADQAARMRSLLAPLEAAGMQPRHETLLALRTRLPLEQGLTSYYANVHRDWCWGDEENEASLALLAGALGGEPPGRMLVLGAGAGRLARDLHESCAAALTVAADINPLLLFVAREVLSGEAVELYEFPVAPRTLEDEARLRTLRASHPVSGEFFLVAADALRAPFAPERFDTVVTPWFIDIVAETLPGLAARINGLLAPRGRWLNFGSLSFAQGARAARFSLEETLEIAAEAGFETPRPLEAQIPYMRSPASRHGRLETVLAWSARKLRTGGPVADFSVLPEWLARSDLPVPALPEFRFQATATRIHAFLMALIDGERTVGDMARMLIEQRLMGAADAEPAVRSFLARLYEDTRNERPFTSA